MPNFPLSAQQLRDELADISKRLVDDFDGDNIMFTAGADVRRLANTVARMEDRRDNKAKSPPVDAGTQTELTEKEREEGEVPEGEHVAETPQEKLDNVTKPSRTGRKQRADHPAQPRGPSNG